MPRHEQPTGKRHVLQQRQRTSPLELVHRVATDAAEVVVVAPAGRLVACGVTRKMDGDHLSVALELAEVAVHGCQADPFDVSPRPIVELLRREWAGGVLESLKDGPPLSGPALHGYIVPAAPRDESPFSLPSWMALTGTPPNGKFGW